MESLRGQIESLVSQGYRLAAGALVNLHFGKCAFVEPPPIGARRTVAVGEIFAHSSRIPLTICFNSLASRESSAAF